jgi:hypothetical protein
MAAAIRHLSARGKNMLFLNRLGGILQLDRFANADPRDLKRAFTPNVVRQIYEAVAEIWPSSDDLERVLQGESVRTSGLYVGTYEPESIIQGVTRHTIYSESLLLVDPFTHPRKVRDEYSPLLHPEQYRPTAFRCTLFWLQMLPWIEAGIVRIIRTPGDLNTRIEHESNEIQTRRFDTYPELKELIRQAADEQFNINNPLVEHFVLHEPDEQLTAGFKEMHPDLSDADLDKFMSYIRARRERNPYYMEPLMGADGKIAQLIVTTSGASYDMAKQIAQLTKSHLITDLPSRWKEIELDRSEGDVDNGIWTPFAKAFHGLDIKYLNDVPLDLVLRLRREQRLEGLRSFMRKVWKTAEPDESFEPTAVENLAAELHDKVREAEDEWAKIGRDLLKWLGGVGALATPFIAKGGAEWTAAAIGAAVAGAGALAISTHQRNSFQNRYPAGFFLKLKKRKR